MRRALVLFVTMIVVAVGVVFAQVASVGPIPEKELLEGLKAKNLAGVAEAVKQRGVDFDLNPQIEKRLRKAKADDALIELIKNAGPTARAQHAQQAGTQGPQMTKEEAEAFTAVRTELDPDKAIQLASDFAQKFPQSALLTYAYWFEANAFQQKGDVEKVVEYGDKSLESKSDNLMALLLLCNMLPQPQYLKSHEMDKEKQLAQAEDYANRALKLIDQVPRQANETDEQYQKRKASYAAGAHASLGMIHLERSQLSLAGPDKDELAKAETEYKEAVQASERPDPRDYYRLGETYNMEGKLDEAIDAFSKAGDLGQGTMIKTYADQRVEELKKRKAAQASAPSKP